MIYNLYVSGYSNDFAGIYQLEFDSESKSFNLLSTNNDSINPVHILVKDDLLFSANEIEEVARISSFKILEDGSLKFINRLDGPGQKTCDISIGEDVVYGANYDSGNIFSVVFEKSGELVEVMSNMEHVGKDPSAHSTILTKDNKYLYEANMGLDRLFIYEVFYEGVLRVHPIKASEKLADFEGPRHMTIDKNGDYLFVVNEYGNSVYSYQINKENGLLTFVDKIRLIEQVESYAADIHLSLDDKYVYASLRGSDEIVQIKQNFGKLEIVNRFYSGGNWPRSFKISSDNKYMFVTNQNSNNVSVLEINPNDGSLSLPIANFEMFKPTSVVIK